LTVLTAIILILIIVGLQITAPKQSSPAPIVPANGVKVASTSDWQGLAWGGTRKLAVDSKGTTYIAYRTQPGGQGYARAYVDFSKDNGLTWSHLGGGPIYTGGQTQRVPAIALSSDDVIHAVWYQVPNDTGPADRQIWYSRWTGSQWTTPKIIPYHIDGYLRAPDASHWQEHPDILVDRSNPQRIYVVWEGTDLANLANGKCASSNCDTPMMTVSNDNGLTWSNYTKLAPPNGEVHSRPTIVQDSTGTLRVTWYGEDPGDTGNNRIRYTFSADRGNTWSNSTAPIPETYGTDQRYPSMAADSQGRVHLVWKERDTRSQNNYTMYSVLSSETWSAPIVVHSDGQNQLNAMVQVDERGNVYVGWNTGGPFSWNGDPPAQFDNSQILLARFDGNSWSVRQLSSSSTNRFLNLPGNMMKSPNVPIAWVQGSSPKPYNVDYSFITF